MVRDTARCTTDVAISAGEAVSPDHTGDETNRAGNILCSPVRPMGISFGNALRERHLIGSP